jgi:DNA-binding CsgD family transcriptional regulator
MIDFLSAQLGVLEPMPPYDNCHGKPTARPAADGLHLLADGMANLLRSVGSHAYIDALIDIVGSLTGHDQVTVTRYHVGGRPDFVAYRNFSLAQVDRYLARFHEYDPFNSYWCSRQRPGVVALRSFTNDELKRGPYVAEFLHGSAIRDEVGLLIDDGPGTTLGVFLERSGRTFGRDDLERLTTAYPAISAAHSVQRRFSRGVASVATEPSNLWPELSSRERQIAELIVAGESSRRIAARLGLAAGTVRNHRLSLYGKLDITSEREVFTTYLRRLAGSKS